jgi:hypothetical protein
MNKEILKGAVLNVIQISKVVLFAKDNGMQFFSNVILTHIAMETLAYARNALSFQPTNSYSRTLNAISAT